MSYKGINIVSGILSDLQQARIKLLEMGSKDLKTKSGKQDILLGHMLEDMKEAVKKDFIKITSQNIEEKKK